ncbi:hypothetical protein FKW77_000111 [Venturia effusa]|uniref:Uncharacterized protein n=1 Tax=Venturia effusa TaxID=50376 RepID=A0A517L2G3_9PEZI|nr:hypothetical protein FKW77_000111 [Venturia effusa]
MAGKESDTGRKRRKRARSVGINDKDECTHASMLTSPRETAPKKHKIDLETMKATVEAEESDCEPRQSTYEKSEDEEDERSTFGRSGRAPGSRVGVVEHSIGEPQEDVIEELSVAESAQSTAVLYESPGEESEVGKNLAKQAEGPEASDMDDDESDLEEDVSDNGGDLSGSEYEESEEETESEFDESEIDEDKKSKRQSPHARH